MHNRNSDIPEGITVTFLPHDLKVTAPNGESLVLAARDGGIEIETPCGGNGTCGGCAVRIIEGDQGHYSEDRALLDAEQLADGMRLACRIKLTGDMVVDTSTQRDDASVSILTHTPGRQTELNPALKKIKLEVPQPSSDDQRADWERVKEIIEERTGLVLPPPKPDLLRELPGLIRDNDGTLSLLMHNGDVLDIADHDGEGPYGIALDVGTTTIVGYLLDLRDGREVAVASTLNGQSVHGFDVLSRISFVQTESDGLATLHSQVVASINNIVRELSQKANIQASDIYHVTVVGNTCMHHLLLKLDPQNIGLSPYVPVLSGSYALEAEQLDVVVNPRAIIEFLPNIAGFVGADTVAVMLSTLIHESDEICLALDIGTNGEMVMGNREGVLVCSAAAGPAFEGAKIEQGMRASDGAIHRVRMGNGVLTCDTINGRPAKGICGSGLIDAVALLLDHGLLDETGRLLQASGDDPGGASALRQRLYEESKRKGFVLAYPHETSARAPVTITQQDIRELQLAKGAIYAGIQTLKQELGVSDGDIAKIYLAGAFGNYLNPAGAMRIGLIPAVPLEKIIGIGNAAGHGARLALLSVKEMERAREIAVNARYVELAARADFQDHFMQAMYFPTAKEY